MRFPTVFLLILTLAAASPAPMGSLQRRAYETVQLSTDQAFVLRPSTSPITNLQGIQTYFQGDGNFVVSVPPFSQPLSNHNRPTHHPLKAPSSTSHSQSTNQTLTYYSYQGRAISSSGTSGYDCEGYDKCRLSWQSDGNLVVYINDVNKWASDTAGKGEKLTFSSEHYSIEITGESTGSVPTLWHAADTGNEPDPGLGEPSVCDGTSCFSCSDCLVVDE